MRDHHAVTCQCGKVAFGASGSPISTGVCYCGDCQVAGRRFDGFLDADGGTPAVLYRKDRVHCEAGHEHLAQFRLKPDSATRRIVAICCNSPMLLDFTKGHWLSLYRTRFGADAPAIEMRVMTRDRPAGVVLPNDVPSYEGFSGRFLRRLILAWIAMGFRRPDIGLNDLPVI